MSNKTKKKQVQNQAQDGRSMVEMLGVLAIIGVLSIGGISGYRMAMDRYQANQIANEINLMRTDAKVKAAAQVTGKLMLGEPYDSGHLNLNSHYGVEFDFAVFSEAGEPEESGYYIKVSGVPAGVCKPLVTLLEGMDDALAVVVNNDPENNADSSADLCIEESNALEVDFSTKDLGVSGGEKEEACDEETCEGYCSADGACKDCPDDAPWNEATRQCKCSSSQHWNKEIEACAACGDNSHCTSSSKPVCNAEGNCDTCKNVYPDTPNWNGSECVAECPMDKPISYNNQCVECRKNEDCPVKDEQHYWCDTNTNNGTCKTCTYGWDETHGCKFGECESNADCASHGEGYYCYLYTGNVCGREFKSGTFGKEDIYTSECRKAESDINKSGDTSSKYTMSTKSMTWWSAERFCEALGLPQATRESIGCGEVGSGPCTSETLTTLKAAGFSDWVWLEDYGDSCYAYPVNLNSGDVKYYSRTRSYYALCE